MNIDGSIIVYLIELCYYLISIAGIGKIEDHFLLVKICLWWVLGHFLKRSHSVQGRHKGGGGGIRTKCPGPLG